jgi:FKBP-type peptidyl-prolyl cis-trans isomerase 2
MAGEEKSTKKRDPIFSVCLVVFAIAAVAVLGSFVYDEYIKEDGVEVEFGDTVVVGYIGTYYAYYGEDNAVVFDTTYSSVGNNDDVAKSNSFNRTSYSDYTVNVGSGSSLAGFEDALIGHKVGDTVKVMIPKGEGYNSSVPIMKLLSGSVDVVDVMTKAQYEALYGTAPVAGESKEITTVYGWSAFAALGSNGTVTVNSVVAGLASEYIYDEDSPLKIVNVQNVGDVITFDYQLIDGEYKVVDAATGEIQMIELNLNGSTVYITNYLNGEISYKTVGESYNIDLYYEIKIVSIN